MSDLTQPPPQPGKEDVTEAVIQWLHQRRNRGIAKYGTSLQTMNGRDPVADALEEHLDAIQYLMQWRLERQALMRVVLCARDVMERGWNEETGTALDLALKGVKA